MKASVQRGPDHWANLFQMPPVVTLNGAPVFNVVFADDEKGFVDLLAICICGDGVETVINRVFGEVQIIAIPDERDIN